MYIATHCDSPQAKDKAFVQTIQMWNANLAIYFSSNRFIRVFMRFLPHFFALQVPSADADFAQNVVVQNRMLSWVSIPPEELDGLVRCSFDRSFSLSVCVCVYMYLAFTLFILCVCSASFALRWPRCGQSASLPRGTCDATC
jgi:hypothetical protein